MSLDVYGHFAAYIQDQLGYNTWVAEEVETENIPYIVVEDRGFSTEWQFEGQYVDKGSLAVHCFAQSGNDARLMGTSVKRLFGTVSENDEDKIPIPPSENFRFVNIQRSGYSLHIEPDPDNEGNRVYRFEVVFDVTIQGIHTLPIELDPPTINHLQLRNVRDTIVNGTLGSTYDITIGITDPEADQFQVQFFDVPNSTWSGAVNRPSGSFLTLPSAIAAQYDQSTYPYLRVRVQSVLSGMESGWSEANMTVELRRPTVTLNYANGSANVSLSGFGGNFSFKANDTLPRVTNPEEFTSYSGQNLATIPNTGRFLFGANSYNGFSDLTVGMPLPVQVDTAPPDAVTDGTATGPDGDNITATWSTTARAVWFDIYVDEVLIESDVTSPYAMPPGQVNGSTVNVHARNAFGDTTGSNFTLSY